MKPTQLLVIASTLLALAAQPVLAQTASATGATTGTTATTGAAAGTGVGAAAATTAAIGTIATSTLVVGAIAAAVVVAAVSDDGGTGTTSGTATGSVTR
ncbi:hypothetical protein [Malikia sp.]|uniref:hypothetical protein n=1 Tax=Malikia sp. TaxID=2070706 RepID=UPI00260F1CCB|nr:hypothetical protein [Malikia sp.]MDD2727781.1 hypothetical protein [Malikia sp.]